MKVDFYTFINHLFNAGVEKVEVLFFSAMDQRYHGSVRVSKGPNSRIEVENNKTSKVEWTTLRKGSYAVDSIESPGVRVGRGCLIKISYVPRTRTLF